MDKAFHGPVFSALTPRPRFSPGRGVRRGLAACLWFWTTAGPLIAHAVAAPDSAAPDVSYQQARNFFNRRNYRHALDLLERLPDDSTASQKADDLNLRGAVYLRQGRFDQARAAFAEAARTDPKLWAARYNEAEVSFQEKRYTESRREFDHLLGHTSRVFHPEEHRFLDYKARLADVCAGQDQSAREFIDQHRNDPAPPLAWYYLNAALEQQQGRPQKAAQWLAQADGKQPGTNARPYEESLERLRVGGSEPAAESRTTAIVSNRRSNHRPPGVGESIATRRERSEGNAAHENVEAAPREASAPPATVAVVQLLPGDPSAVIPDGKDFTPDGKDAVLTAGPASRADSPDDLAVQPASGDAPPVDPGLFPDTAKPVVGDKMNTPLASVLAKPRRGRGTPTPSPTPGATPTPGETPAAQPGNGAATDASTSPTPTATPATSPTATASPSPTPDASPAAATPEFTQKYEAAYVKFLEKDYPATLDLLDEADKLQPKQPQTATLRAQVFKQEYETAYLAYRKADYPTALNFLDLADRAQPNYPDSLNLRGLVYAKQRVYDRAETMFKRAVEIDPTLWAAKFNYAELPFNRGDYTTARSRFEDLLGETDAAKRPREAELTQYKVFLTLLLEGKTDQARAFMEHFNFSGATPAKYFCNAAMNFRAGTTDKAIDWINSAKKEYPAQLVSIFLESFYRLGWMADPNAASPGVGALAAASPAVEAAAPSIAPAPTAAPSVAASAGTSPTPAASVAALASATPASSPVLLAASSPSATVALGTAAPVQTPAASAAPSIPPSTPATTPTPVPSATPAVTPEATATASPEESVAKEAGEADEEGVTAKDILRLGIVAAVLLYVCWTSYRLISIAARRRAKRRAARAARAARLAAAEHSDNSPE